MFDNLAAQGVEITWHTGAMAVIVLGVVVGLVKNFAPADMLLLSATITAALLGIIPVDDAFSGFANSAMLTVAALFVVAAGLKETGALNVFAHWYLGKCKTERAVLVRLAGTVTVFSAFLNNTPIVAMFIPMLTSWCKQHRVSPSRVLLPLSYMTILGGTCTLVGTSTNLLVNGLMIQEGMEPMSLFELSRAGVPYAIVGIIYILIVGPRLLPVRQDLIEHFGANPREYLVNLRIDPGCRLVGQRVEEAGLRHLPGLFLIEIGRADEIITPVGPGQLLELNDVLTFTGVVDTIVDLERISGLTPIADENYANDDGVRRGRLLHEAVISNTSPLVNKSIRDSDFRAQYNSAVLAVHRGGERLLGRVGDIVLRSGDTLLLQSGPHFARANRNNPDFYLVSSVEDSRPYRSDKAIVSVLLLGVLILLMATNVVPIVLAAFMVGGLMLTLRCLSMVEARQSIQWQTLITIGAAIGLSKGLESSGLVSLVAAVIVGAVNEFGPYALLAAIYLLTSIFTELVTNNAAAALMFPFSIAMADKLGVDPRPFIIATTLAASASFITPMGYQTNLMVYGPGGYQYKDFVRMGVPLNLILFALATLIIPLIWPFLPE